MEKHFMFKLKIEVIFLSANSQRSFDARAFLLCKKRFFMINQKESCGLWENADTCM